MLRSRSLPAFPTASPQIQPQKLTGSLGCSIDELQSIADNYIASQAEKLNSLASAETLKKDKEGAFLSSCESAKTVCETEPALSARTSINGIPKGTLGFPGVKVDHKELGAEPRSEDDSPGDESCLRRPDYLKGLASFQRSHSTIASLGLAFPSQNGSAAVGRWPSLVDRNPDDWENFAFSLGYEPNSNRTASTHRYSLLWHAPRPLFLFYYSLENVYPSGNVFRHFSYTTYIFMTKRKVPFSLF